MKSKNKIVRYSVFSVLFLTVLWLAIPQFYIHELFQHKHEILKSTATPSFQTDQDYDYDKYNTPLYFSIFKFINNFVPIKPKSQAYLIPSSKILEIPCLQKKTSRAPTLV